MNVKIALQETKLAEDNAFNVLRFQPLLAIGGSDVEKKEGTLKGRPDVVIQESAGIYSLSPYSPRRLWQDLLVRDPRIVV